MLVTAFFCLLALAGTVTCVWPFDTNFLSWAWQSGKYMRLILLLRIHILKVFCLEFGPRGMW